MIGENYKVHGRIFTHLYLVAIVLCVLLTTKGMKIEKKKTMNMGK